MQSYSFDDFVNDCNTRLEKIVATDALLAAVVANPEANLKRSDFGFDLAAKKAMNIYLAMALMRTPDLPLLDFV